MGGAEGPAGYRPGACNIGPAEIAARRRGGHLGTAATLALLGALLATGAPRPLRLLVFVPASGAAAGYLQAASRFCIGFAWRGVFNLGERVGDTSPVADDAARRRDRARGLRLAALSAAVGTLAAAVAVRL